MLPSQNNADDHLTACQARCIIKLDMFSCEKLETETGEIKQPDLVLVQYREENTSVTSHYREKEGWEGSLKNYLKEFTNTFTSHKPFMSTK